MTRTELSGHLDMVTAAADAKGLRADVTVADGAADIQIDDCESSLGVRLPDEYRPSLREWNGCSIRIMQPSSLPSDEIAMVRFDILNTEYIALQTVRLRESIGIVLEGLPNSAPFAAAMSRVAAITYHDDVAALLTDADEQMSDANTSDVADRSVLHLCAGFDSTL